MTDLHIGAHEGAGVAPFPAQDESATSGPLDDIKTGLKMFADFGVTIGKHVDQQQNNWAKMMRLLQRNTPVDYAIAASGSFPASGSLLLPFGSPDQGTRWEVTGCVCGGLDLNVAAAGTAGLYVSALQPQLNQPAPGGLSNAADYASFLPNVAFYGTRQLVVNDQEYLFLVVFGGTPGQAYVANMSATVFNVASAGGKDTNIL